MSDSQDIDNWFSSQKPMGKAIEDAALFYGIVTKNFLSSPQCALQIGWALVMDKPIALIIDNDVKHDISKALIRAATIIEFCDINDKVDMKRANDAIQKFIAEQS